MEPGRHSEEHWWGTSTDLFVDEAIRFIDERPDSPFYINLWTLIPHATLDPTPKQLAVYDGLTTNPEDFHSRMREYFSRAEDPNAQMKVWCASITSLDAAIGRLLRHLADRGLADDTIVFFTSDNGPEDYRVRNASNAGVVDRSSIVGSVDWFPTVCSWTSVPMPDIAPDGEDVSDVLAGTAPAGDRGREVPLFWEWRCNVFGEEEYHPPTLAVREGPWKLFMNAPAAKPGDAAADRAGEPAADGDGIELYDIEHDPGELINRAGTEPEMVGRLSRLLADWKATLPDRDPMYD